MTVQQLRDALSGLPGEAKVSAKTGDLVELFPQEGLNKGPHAMLFTDIPSALDKDAVIGLGSVPVHQ